MFGQTCLHCSAARGTGKGARRTTGEHIYPEVVNRGMVRLWRKAGRRAELASPATADPRAAGTDQTAMVSILFPHHRDHDHALPMADVALQVKDLLPGAQHEVSLGDRN